jgi:hypothetical protein
MNGAATTVMNHDSHPNLLDNSDFGVKKFGFMPGPLYGDTDMTVGDFIGQYGRNYAAPLIDRWLLSVGDTVRYGDNMRFTMDECGEPCFKIAASGSISGTDGYKNLMQSINPEYTNTRVTYRMTNKATVSVTAKVKCDGPVLIEAAVFNTETMYDAQYAEYSFHSHWAESASVENTDAPAIITLKDSVELDTIDYTANPYWWFRFSTCNNGYDHSLYLYWIKMEFGSPTPYISPDSTAELAKCKRFQDRTIEIVRPYYISATSMSAIIHWDPPEPSIYYGLCNVECSVYKLVGTTPVSVSAAYAYVDIAESGYVSPAGTVELTVGLPNNHGLTYENAEIVVTEKIVYDY